MTGRVAVTGAEGFLGWHLACRLRALRGAEPVLLGRADFADPDRLRDRLADVETLYHLAGVNRAETEDAVERGNVRIAKALVEALGDRRPHLVFANSIQAELDNPYGRGKSAAAKILTNSAATFADVLLPNLFGEHGRPAYNSFVATFCHEVAGGRLPTVANDKVVPLLHAQAAAQVLMDAGDGVYAGQIRPEGTPRAVSQVLEQLLDFQALYAERGEIPDIASPFSRDLFNTYRAALFPRPFPVHPRVFSDARGDLLEAGRMHGGTGQTFVSITQPGQTRGNHYHLQKIERFCVVRGEAEIKVRRLLHGDVTEFRVSGDRPGFVDMPTLWVHNITNVGAEELVTVFWADQLLDPEDPDQYPEMVEAIS